MHIFYRICCIPDDSFVQFETCGTKATNEKLLFIIYCTKYWIKQCVAVYCTDCELHYILSYYKHAKCLHVCVTDSKLYDSTV